MSAVDLLGSILITWSVILIPPAAVRALMGRPLSKVSAVAWAASLFIINHIFFAWLTEKFSARPFLAIGVVAAFYVLTWQTCEQAKVSVQQLRRSMGYDQEESGDSRQDGQPAPEPAAPRDESKLRPWRRPWIAVLFQLPTTAKLVRFPVVKQDRAHWFSRLTT